MGMLPPPPQPNDARHDGKQQQHRKKITGSTSAFGRACFQKWHAAI
jgi:hypothetical protein